MTRDVVRSDAQHKLPPYLRHAPDRIESLERVLDDETIDEVLSLPQLAHVAAAFGAQIATGAASTPDAAAAGVVVRNRPPLQQAAR